MWFVRRRSIVHREYLIELVENLRRSFTCARVSYTDKVWDLRKLKQRDSDGNMEQQLRISGKSNGCKVSHSKTL